MPATEAFGASIIDGLGRRQLHGRELLPRGAFEGARHPALTRGDEHHGAALMPGTIDAMHNKHRIA